MTTENKRDRVLAPLTNTTRGHWILLLVFGVGSLMLLVAWIVQLTQGLYNVTALGDWGTSAEVPWGLYIGTFVWWIGIAHGGIAVSAAVRVFKLERFQTIARIAEILTILALAMAAANIIFDLARPERIFNTLIQWPFTVHHSPLAWDIAVVTLYLVLSLTYLTMSLRPDLAAIKHRVPFWIKPIYSFVLIGYEKGEREKTNRMLWWLAVAILALVPLLSGGVVPWLFGLVGAQPGWYGAAAGPSMLIESLTSAVAVVIIVAAAYRYAYGWEDIIEDQIFWDLAKVLALLIIATIWLIVHDILTGIYLGPTHVADLTMTLLALPFFWFAVLGIVLVTVYLIAGMLRPDFLTIPGLVVASIIISVMILNKKVMFVVEGLMHPTMPPLANLYPAGTYFPSLVEWAMLIGTISVVGLGFVVIGKVIPMIELHALEEETEFEPEVPDERTEPDRPGVAGDDIDASGEVSD